MSPIQAVALSDKQYVAGAIHRQGFWEERSFESCCSHPEAQINVALEQEGLFVGAVVYNVKIDLVVFIKGVGLVWVPDNGTERVLRPYIP